jgi:HSP20 family molecular chaperone IbpA
MYGRFYRAIPVPEGANAEKATARFNNGVLVSIALRHDALQSLLFAVALAVG